MAYKKLNLSNGATLDAGHLAHMEQGIADALPATELDAAIESALATAKERGEFDGADGADGADGYTPVKGTDYWTATDRQEMVDELIADVAPVSYNAQSLTDEQKAQALKNIGALPDTYTPPNQTAEQVGADPAGTANAAISQHNVSTDAHNEIRLLITELTTRLNALANSDDVTLDQMAEVVAYIKDNRDLIEQVTTGKVSVSDIVDNLTTNVSNKPLSAAQGVALKALVDAAASAATNAQQNIDKKLDKLTLEHWIEKAFGSTGLLYIGKFGVYDSQITVDITATTGLTYSGKLVIATQNYQVRSAYVYGDAANTITPNIYIKPCTTEDKYVEIYFKPQSWSKNAIHVYGVAVSSSENVCTSATEVPETATLQPINALTEKFAGKLDLEAAQSVIAAVGQVGEETAEGLHNVTLALDAHVRDMLNPHMVTAAQVGAPTVAQMNEAIAAASLGSGSGSGGGAGSWSDLGEGVGMATMLEETTLENASTQLSEELGLIVGNTYTVTWNGVEYSPTAVDASALASVEGAIVLGMSGSYPFTILVKPGSGTMISIDEGSAPVTVSVTGVGNIIIPIPGKYLPTGTPWIDGEVYLDESYASSFTHPSFGTMWRIFKEVKLKVGETYTVIYNGTSYNCVCQAAPSGLIEDPDAVAMGNFSVVGGANTGEPFAMLISYYYREVDIIDLSSASSVECAIHAVGTTISKIDDVCLPNTMIVNVNISAMTADKTCNDIWNAIQNKQDVFLVDNSTDIPRYMRCVFCAPSEIACFIGLHAGYTNGVVSDIVTTTIGVTADGSVLIKT